MIIDDKIYTPRVRNALGIPWKEFTVFAVTGIDVNWLSSRKIILLE